MRIGISSYTFTWAIGVTNNMPANPLSAFGLIDKAKVLGINLVQIADNLPLDAMSEDELSRFLAYAMTHDVSVQPGTAGTEPGHLKRYLEIALACGSNIVRTIPDTKERKPSVEEIIQDLKAVAPQYRRSNVRIALENHDRFRCEDLVAIVRSVGEDTVGICLDTVNSFGALEGPSYVIEKLLPYTFNVHIKDFTIFREYHKMGFRIEGRPAGKGMLLIEPLLQKLNSSRPEVDAILELWTSPEVELYETIDKEDRWAVESVQYLKSFI